MTRPCDPALKRKASETANKVFTTEPKIRRHLSGLTPTRRRAAFLMEALFQNGFVKEAPYDTIYNFVVEKAGFIGLDERTVTQYIGRPRRTLRENENPRTSLRIAYPKTGTTIGKEYTAVKTLPEKSGICQKLGYMKFAYRKNAIFLILNHHKVPLPYHLKQQRLLSSEKRERTRASKEDLCVLPIGSPKDNREASIETMVIESRERRDSKEHTQIRSKDWIQNCIHDMPKYASKAQAELTPLERAILRIESAAQRTAKGDSNG